VFEIVASVTQGRDVGWYEANSGGTFAKQLSV